MYHRPLPDAQRAVDPDEPRIREGVLSVDTAGDILVVIRTPPGEANPGRPLAQHRGHRRLSHRLAPGIWHHGGRIGGLFSPFVGAWALDLAGPKASFTVFAIAVTVTMVSLAIVGRHIRRT